MVAMVAGAAFAADASASVYMDGFLAKGKMGGETDLFYLKSEQQQDPDAIQFNFSGEKAGASFKLWYEYGSGKSGGSWDSDDAYDLYVRSAQLWFKPIEQIKISVGDVGSYLYKERLHWWKVATGAGAVAAVAWNGRWSSYTTVEGKGVSIEATPISGLAIDFDWAPGVDTNAVTLPSDGSDVSYNAWGAQFKYQVLDNLSFAAGYRDGGSSGKAKIATIGVDFGNFGTPYYGFIQPRFYIGSKSYTEPNWWIDPKDEGLTGVTIDNYIQYTTGNLTLKGRFPFTIRMTGLDNDPSFLVWEVKAVYACEGFSPYLAMGNDQEGIYQPLCFGSKEGFTVAD